ncbi:MAG: phosphoenolpyruvate--protein phosphotransferase [Oscillospiraceae bacterium]|jgi:phosphotransferase system enzyme I (PtsI)|nr:phosphoenolpyruvate--protein phosphotransferase [Oscillospiraceae bacterium]
MTVLKGRGVFGGIAFGVLKAFKRDYFGINSEKIYVSDHQNEIEKFKYAKDLAIKQLDNLYNEALEEVGEEHAMIFQVHRMMIEDIEYANSIISIIINENANAEYAIWLTSRNFERSFEAMESDYMQQRAVDVRDVSKRIVSCINNLSDEHGFSGRRSIIIGADDLTPSEVLELNRKVVKGFVTMLGSENSHTSILARAMGIPCVIGLGEQLRPEFEKCEAIIDSFAGAVYISPDRVTVKRLKKKKELCEQRAEFLNNFKGKEDVTLDGQKIELCANIGNVTDLGGIIESDARGVGLFRSEFIFMGRSDYPTEDEQFKIYKKLAQKLEGKHAIIRTLDVGADKKIDYFNLPYEVNPAIGYRAIRICLDRIAIFKTQIRAILRASAFGNIKILFPMIISLDEVLKIKQILNEVKHNLIQEEIEFDKNIKIGIMIETPAAVMISDILAKEVDFFNIGTNDLIQYTLAVDRQNDKINFLYNPRHIAILRMIKIVCDNAKKNNVRVGICGEIAADETLIETFLAMGIDELSMSSAFILSIRKRVREIDVKTIKDKILKEL